MDDIEASPELADAENDAPKNSGEEPVARKPGSKGQGRKRTKTGCLTCRKRRIKCGEERPTCHNCTKSKRQCEGYNQRLVFKSPINDYRPSASSSGHSNQPRHRRGSQVQAVPAIPNPPTIAPKSGKSSKSSPSLINTIPTSTLPAPSAVVDSRLYSFQTSVTQENFPKTQPLPQSFDTKTDTVDRSHIPEPSQRRFQEHHDLYLDSNDSDASIKHEAGEGILGSVAQDNRYSDTKRVEGSSSPSFYAAQELFQDSNRQFPASAAFYQPYHATADWSPPARDPFLPEQRTRTEYQSSQGTIESSNAGSSRRQELHPRTGRRTSPPTEVPLRPTLATKESLYYLLEEEDDPFDISDDDMIMESDSLAWQDNSSDQYMKSNDLGIQVVVAMKNGQPFHDSHLRSVTSFINRPDMLATYVPSPQSSPLSDPMTARIFCHFVSVTGPCISMFERHPANPALIFQGQPVPASQQHMWTYTFPTLALRNPALLHAMLALASLHIAKLQNGPVTASLKHYAISLRRVGKLINNPTRQKEPVTLAAALLLAFYECWCADHQKWSNHVLGARQLVRLIDFAGMTKNIKQAKIRQRQEKRMRYYQANQQHTTGHNLFEERMRYQAFVEDVDENLVGILMGKKVRYDQHGQILDDMNQDTSTIQYSEKDLELYETQRDLFWWYCKQDTYQSILGGGRLFMDYELWANCPPRAPIGRLNATYGTYDHLMLLLGRLANFAAKDIKRKRLAARATGGWRPPMNMFNQPNQGSMRPDPQSQTGPSQPPPQFRANPNQLPPQMPGFSGMFPGVQEAQLPMGFSGQNTRNSGSCSPHSHRSEEADLATQLAEAEEEWQDIRNAFAILEDHFGEDFQPLGSEFCSPIETTFGTALQYRTYGIAGIWLNYHMGLIVCDRAHPSMPPAAMMASGIAARQTAKSANEIGRITAGIAPDYDTTQHVNPGVGAALLESTTSLFVAGVQYQNPHQRHKTITHLHNVARLTGWQTALAIANGCETSWIKTAEMGRGPPYMRMSEETARAARGHIAGEGVDIWNTGRRIDRAFSGRTDEERRGMLRLEGSRVHYALGVLGVESDFEGLGLDDDEVGGVEEEEDGEE